MPAEVHLPEAVLGMDEALGHEEVMGGAGFHGRDSRFISCDADLGIEARQRHVTVRGGKRPTHDEDTEQGEDQQQDEDCGEDADEDLHAHEAMRSRWAADRRHQCTGILGIRVCHVSPSAKSEFQLRLSGEVTSSGGLGG